MIETDGGRGKRMTERLHQVEAEGVSLVLDLDVGHIRSFAVRRGGALVTPLHTAPWVGADETAGDGAPNVRRLSGDFLCAPFGKNDVEVEAPPHGWPANSAWDLLGVAAHASGGAVARYRLRRRVLRAEVTKELTLRDGHPFLYQRHVFAGGEGSMPVASHAMTRFGAGGGRLSFSPKLWGETPDAPLEPDPALGVFALRYPARFEDLGAAPDRHGNGLDLRRYPLAARNEDFAVLVEDPANPLGWTAAVRPDAGDVFLSLKRPATLPVTMLWFSNGGRSYAPWNGRHIGVLGVEEGRSYGGAGHRASAGANPMNAAGVSTALALVPGGTAEIRHVVGGAPLGAGWPAAAAVAAVSARPGELLLASQDGATLALPFDDTFLAA